MKSKLALGSVLVASSLLAACGGGGGGGGDNSAGGGTPPPPSLATLSVERPSDLIAESGQSVAVVVRNTSTSQVARNVQATLPASWTDVTQDASACATLTAQSTCAILLTPGNTPHDAATIAVGGDNAESASLSLAVAAPSIARINVVSSPASLEAGSSTASAIRVRNTSSSVIARNIAANFSGTALAGLIDQDATGCATVQPGATCDILVTPKTTAVAHTSFSIKGDNTRPYSASLQITSPTLATVSLSNSPLVLQATAGTPAAGIIHVKNESSTVTATDVHADLAGAGITAVTQDATACATLAPQASCELRLLPGASALPLTSFQIRGTNLVAATGAVVVNAPSAVALTVSGGPLNFLQGDAGRTLTITNTSSTEPALNVQPDLVNARLNTKLTVVANTCDRVEPGASCSVTLSPNSIYFGLTQFGIAGSNTQTTFAGASVAPKVGDFYQGGVVVSLASDATPGVIADWTNHAGQWSPTALVTGATSLTDGNANSSAIAAVHTGGSTAAEVCRARQVLEGSTTIGGWYLPARNELSTLLQAALGNDVNVLAGSYWSSTEDGQPNAIAFDAASVAATSVAKSTSASIKCVRQYTWP